MCKYVGLILIGALFAGSLDVLAQEETFSLEEAFLFTEAEVELPDGSTRTLEVNPQKGELVFGDTMKQGTYRVSAGTNEVFFCVNLLDSGESDTTPKSELKFGKYAQTSSTTFRRANMEIWRWIAAASLAVLMFEWWYYHRRTV